MSTNKNAQCNIWAQSCDHVLYLLLGDGGNDVSMIQAADAGIGIVGKVSRRLIYESTTRTFCQYILMQFTETIYQKEIFQTNSKLFEVWFVSLVIFWNFSFVYNK